MVCALAAYLGPCIVYRDRFATEQLFRRCLTGKDISYYDVVHDFPQFLVKVPFKCFNCDLGHFHFV